MSAPSAPRALLPLAPKLAWLALALACTRAELLPLPPPDSAAADNKVTVRGEFCTTNPDELRFPVKILFILDASSSMDVTDPALARIDAIIDVIDRMRDPDPDLDRFREGVEIGVISFGIGANVLTDRCDDYTTRAGCVAGFAGVPSEAIRGAIAAGIAAGTTDYAITLQTALSMLAADMANSDEDDRQNARYVLIFLSDGIPDVDSSFNPQAICNGARLWAETGQPPTNPQLATFAQLLDNMRELARRYNVRELTFNGAYLADPLVPPNVKSCGSNLIRAMSSHLDGTFRDFSSGERINFLFVDFTSFKRIYSLKNFVVKNANARPFSEALYAAGFVGSTDPTLAAGIIDSDGDGLTDELEALIGTDPRSADTDGDGFSDLLEYRLRTSGFDPLDPTDADCRAAIDKLDSDGDGLRDCEERFSGTNPRRFDSDNDGFGDGLEVLYGTNPALDDRLLDVDFDGAVNASEMRWHSGPETDDVRFLGEHAYRYVVRENGIDEARFCYSFEVANISLASTIGAVGPRPTGDPAAPLAAPGIGGGRLEVGENRIYLEVAEAPFDAPNEPGVHRVACVRARFDDKRRLKIPANGILEVPREAFHDPRAFVPDVHCLSPR